jgi:hypothetical protein
MNPRCVRKVRDLYIIDTDYSFNKSWKIVEGVLKQVEAKIRKRSQLDRYVIVENYTFTFSGARCLTKREDLGIMYQANSIRKCEDWIRAWTKERG